MQPTAGQLEIEKAQMLTWWHRQMHGRCWIARPPGALQRIGHVEAAALGSNLRQLHDRLGYCAKGTLATGGLCAGTIYRTAAFIALPQDQRNGTRGGTVHVEHTVPVNVLARQIANMPEATRADLPGMLGWLLIHSVTCAFARSHERFRDGYTRETGA